MVNIKDIEVGDKITLTVVRVAKQSSGCPDDRVFLGPSLADWLNFSAVKDAEHHPAPRPIKLGDTVFVWDDDPNNDTLVVKALFECYATVLVNNDSFQTYALVDLRKVRND